MAPQRTPRHRAAPPTPDPEPLLPVRGRGGPFARHLRSGPRVAVLSGVAAAFLLGPPLGLTVATMTGEVGPEHVGRFGPVVAALPWYENDPQEWLAERDERDDASRTLTGDGRDDGDAADTDASTPADDAAHGTTPAPEEPAATPEPATTEEPAPPEPEPAPAAEAPAPEAPAAGSGAAGSSGGTSASPSGTPAAAPAAGPGTLTAEGAAVVELTNAERAAAGCGALTVDERLTAAAQLHSEDMDAHDYMDHTSLDGRSPWDRAKAQGYPNPGAENVAKGYRTADDVVRAWMNSPGHRANILNCDLREIGVGHSNGAWTQLFGWG